MNWGNLLWILYAAAHTAAVGLLLSLIVGGLISTRNGLLDYGGIKGLLLGLLALHLAQCRMFWRGLWTVRQEEPDLAGRRALWQLWLPVANLIWAGRLKNRLWKRRMERENPAWNQL